VSEIPAPLGGEAASRPTHFGREIEVDPAFLRRLGDVCETVDDSNEGRVDAGRDWWPLSVVWAVEGVNPALPAAVARPGDARQVADVLRLCHDQRVPVTPVAGRSGVCGGSVPIFGGIALDLTGLDGIKAVDDTSLLVDVRAGTPGAGFEETLRRDHDLTLGHWPQSIDLSTVGGWIACRGAGQYSTRYGKIEDMVVGLEVALADGRLVHLGGTAPRTATGPDLIPLFVGSEGTLGVVTEARLRVHPRPPDERRAVFGFPDFTAGLDACRSILRRGATPAVLRLYDPVEAARAFGQESRAVLIVIDEGDSTLIQSVLEVVEKECARGGATPLDTALAGRWLEHRNQLPPLESLVRGGIVADTIEVAASWAALPGIYRDAVQALSALDGTLAASAHQSHAYVDGACLYFTFAGRPPSDPEAYYRQAFDTVMGVTSRAGGTLSHHHGIGLNRSPYMRSYLGVGFDVLVAVKAALDPAGILNPGKLGLPSPFGTTWEG
jgi:alkyldihydroxyacetonephosphate synthase